MLVYQLHQKRPCWCTSFPMLVLLVYQLHQQDHAGRPARPAWESWYTSIALLAQARCHRIGQSKAVKVYRLITRNSYEREMLDKASLKLGLDRAVLQSMSGNKEGNNNGVQQFSKKEIEDLLWKGAYAAIMDKNDEGNRFCEEDIDQILQRRATTITR
ncbi:hypothetical protein F7725_019327 [Dissostichus mawsoni]|uniref:Uncharacterized protein n=1 Tax=Dissostichus mawsoni TaxID=36200 RepID=A0A7J5YMR3_DISMA|nr:hypothetical protein F7725_019327 [Dissostichus mawsoni]